MEGRVGLARAPEVQMMKPRTIAGGIAWLLLALAAISLSDEPGMAVPVWSFWAGSGMLAVRGVLTVLKGERLAPHGKSRSVSVCLERPRQSPNMEQMLARLPPYCGQILRRNPRATAKEA